MRSEFVNEGVIFGRNRSYREKYDRSDPIQSLDSTGYINSHGSRFETLVTLINKTDGTEINRRDSKRVSLLPCDTLRSDDGVLEKE